MKHHTVIKTLLATAALAAAAQAGAQVTLYEHDDFTGNAFNAQRRIPDLSQYGFNDRASSLIIQRDRWEVCEDSAYNGRCVVLGPGRYASLGSMGLNDRITSIRAVSVANRFDRDDDRPAPGYGDRDRPGYGAGDFRRRNGERLYSANVTSVRAVMGTPEQRCWMEREEVPVERRTNVPGAVAGAVLGGILGHQIGGGTGRDIATVGGVVAGGAVGSQVGRNSGTTTREVQRCAQQQGNAKPEYWDVTYTFRGQQHQMQTTQPPGNTVLVNERGEPRQG